MQTAVIEAVLGVLIGYVFGAFPTGYFVGRLYGIDVRRHGSGRTGGTNVLRTAGWVAFLLTVVGDVLKGVIPVLIMRSLASSEIAPAFAVVGALLGHNWSVFLAQLARATRRAADQTVRSDPIREFFAKARGGAGVATTGAAAIALYWPPVVPLAAIGIALVILFRYSSVSSITVAALYPLIMGYFVLSGAAPWVYFLMSVIVAAVVLYVHIPNMKRLRAGTEQKFGQRVGRERRPQRANQPPR